LFLELQASFFLGFGFDVLRPLLDGVDSPVCRRVVGLM
jgi:hypothetical protein